MSNAAHKETFVPRSHLQRTLTYRPHLKWTYYGLLTMAALVWGIYVLATASSLSEGFSAAISECLGPATLLALALYLEARFLIKPRAFTTVHVFNDRLEINRLGKPIYIPFAEVTEIQFRYFPYSRGYFNLCTSDESYTFTLALERSEYILEAVAAFNPKLVSTEKLEAFRRTAITSDHTLAHWHDGLKNKKSLFLKFLSTPITAALVLSAISFFKGNPFVLTSLASTFVVLVLFRLGTTMWGNWFASIVLTFKTRNTLIENPNHLRRDPEFEKRIEYVNQTVQRFLFALAVCGILISILVK